MVMQVSSDRIEDLPYRQLEAQYTTKLIWEYDGG